jgi:membrane fusion protein, multidrug efflux system
MNRTRSEYTIPVPPPDKVLCHFRVTPTLLALLAAGTAIATTSCKKAAPEPPPPPIVQVMDVTATNVPISTEFIGQLDSPQNVEVRARVEAFVEQMPFAEGTEVKPGELLFKLDDRP